jgi:hypothetical protein
MRQMIRSTAARGCIAFVIVAVLLGCPSRARAQGVEITPFGGYRFGGDFFELITGEPVDLDGAPAIGVAVNIPLSNSHGYQIEGLFSHEQADLTVHTQPFGPATIARVTVDHWLGGGLQEFDVGHRQIRPFLTGMLGLTRYAGEGDSEIRFTISAGGGVKLFPARHVGLRLDGRLYTTFVEADLGLLACGTSAGGCLIAFRTDVVFQAEFTAGVVVKFP